jgi:hypothetical protein
VFESVEHQFRQEVYDETAFRDQWNIV